MEENRREYKVTLNKEGHNWLILLILGAIVLSVYTMPYGRSVRYEPSEGNPWMYNELIAPFSFPIEKSDQEIQYEIDSLRSNFIPYFSINDNDSELASAALSKLYDDTLSTVISNKSYVSLIECLPKLYNDGIISSEGEEIINKNHYSYIKGYSGNTSQLLALERIHTQKEAYNLLTESVESTEDRYRLLDFHLEEFIVPNLKYDSERNETGLRELEEQISRYSGMVMANQKIIERGEIVDHNKYQIIISYMNVMKNRTDSVNFKLLTWGGNVLYASILLFVLGFYLVQYRKDIIEDRHRLLFLFIITSIFIVCTNLYIRYSSWSIFILPCTMLALMLRIFLDSRTAFIGYLTYLLLCSIGTPMQFEFIMLQTVAGLVAIYGIHELSQRSQIFTTVFLIFGTYCIIWLALQMIQLEDIKDIQWEVFIYFAINCFILLLTYPLILAIEKVFGFTSNVTLLELSNINNPLLRMLSETAPGTMQHSVQVSALAADAANAIGAFTLLVRTAALYHDIGKTENPAFFTENQSGINPHDRLTPQESAKIIINHVTEGIKLAGKYHLPQSIIHFIETHHGRGMAKYFYIKYLNDNPSQEINSAPFNYSGPDPDTKETAILMMADAVEASSRSLKEYTEDSISILVDKIIDGQISDGRFKNCPITLLEISQIKAVFKERLKAMFHTRISYPDISAD